MADADEDAPGAASARQLGDNSFRPIWLDFKLLAADAPEELVTYARDLRRNLDERRKSRYGFYNERRIEYGNVLSLRQWLAQLGAAGIVLTALATAAHFAWPDRPADSVLLVAAMICYAAMAGISFYEGSLNLSAAYFRQVGILIAMRDIWTRFQFELLAELRAAAAGGADVILPARDRMTALALAAWNDLEALTRGEQENWQGEVLASLKELATAAQNGRSTVETRLVEMEKAAAAAETARTERTAAAARAGAPALLTIAVEGDVAGDLTLRLNDEPPVVTAAREHAFRPRPAGDVHVAASGTGPGGQTLTGALNLELKPGVQTASLRLQGPGSAATPSPPADPAPAETPAADAEPPPPADSDN